MKGKKVKIKDGWPEEGRAGITLGESIFVLGIMWTPVIWDGDRHPEFHKLAGLDIV